ARSWYETTPEAIRTTALRNATLQGAYLMLAARAVGLDCGPMSGFKNDVVDAAFFPDGRFKSNFLCCIGHGDPSTLPKQDPRFTFDEACQIACATSALAQSALAVTRDHAAACDGVVGRGEERDRRRDLLDLRPCREI